MFSKDKTLELQSKRGFYKAGLTGVILSSLALILPESVPEIPSNYTFSFFIFIFFQVFAFFYNLLFVIFFDLFFIDVGRKDREKRTFYIRLAGVFWIIMHALILILPFMEGIYFAQIPHEFSLILFGVLNVIPKMMGVVGSLFLLLFGILNKNKFLIFAAICFMSNFTYLIFTGLPGIQFHS